MKQLISVRAIIRDDNKTLLLKRASGRQTILGMYEVPGGKLGYGEQPDDAIRRYVESSIGLEVQTAQLFDVFTYIDHDDRAIQYTFIVYLVGLANKTDSIVLSEKYGTYAWRKKADIKLTEVTESSQLILGITEAKKHNVAGNTTEISFHNSAAASSDNSHLIVYSDGGSRGNPGPSAAGFVVMNNQEEVISQGGEYLGITTNNQAEYHAVRLGLEGARDLGAKTVDFRLDSLLVVNQLSGVYKIKNRDLWPINERIRELADNFEKVTFTHVKREFNQLADGMVNKTLDAHQSNTV